MKKILCTVLSLVCAATAFSQSAREIMKQMLQYVESHEAEGICLTQTDSITKVHTGRKVFRDVQVYDDTVVYSWIETSVSTEKFYYNGKKHRRESDYSTEFDNYENDREWLYFADINEVWYKYRDLPNPPTMWLYLSGIYDVNPKAYRFKLVSETDDTWVISAKQKIITRHYAPTERMLYIVSKDDYRPINVKVYENYSIGKIKYYKVYDKKDFRFGVTDDELTFHIEDYPGVTVLDKTR
jgi:hypothetical protein